MKKKIYTLMLCAIIPAYTLSGCAASKGESSKGELIIGDVSSASAQEAGDGSRIPEGSKSSSSTADSPNGSSAENDAETGSSEDRSPLTKEYTATEGLIPAYVSAPQTVSSNDESGKLVFSGKYEEVCLGYPQLSDFEEPRSFEGFDGLSASLQALSEEQKADVSKSQADAMSYYSEDPNFSSDNYSYYYSEEYTNTIQRSDEKVFSLVTSGYGFLGGVHPNYWYRAHNYDPESGRELAFSDLVKDQDLFVSAACQELRKEYPDIDQGLIVDSLESGLQELIEENCIQVTAGYTGLNLWLSPYDLTPYAAGAHMVFLSYDAYPELVDQSLTEVPDSYAYHMIGGAPTEIVDRDSGSLSLKAVSTFNSDNYSCSLTVTCGEQTENFSEEGCYGQNLCLVHVNGRNYLYVCGSYDDDWESIKVIALSPDRMSLTSSDQLKNIGFHGFYPVDPANMVLESRTNMLSTCGIRRYYSAGGDGVPNAQTPYWFYMDWRAENPDLPILTSKVDLQMEEVENPGQEHGQEITIPAGTAFDFVATDDSTYAVLRTDQGKLVLVEADNSSWPVMVNGMELDAAFDGTFFAG
ncbi:MAG: hypothetical protein U0L49_04420 [Eubacterium sp.]|nr:hypothetical protein [Eubacterium sp.]